VAAGLAEPVGVVLPGCVALGVGPVVTVAVAVAVGDESSGVGATGDVAGPDAAVGVPVGDGLG
jgi:hypothetical protein